jgi:signal transduction histidine kinase/DNA-binding NarL/FixJ family response regulator/HPt (histidine-containing phosphotransfer) domain-containing protein
MVAWSSWKRRWQEVREDHRASTVLLLSLVGGTGLLLFAALRAWRGEWGLAAIDAGLGAVSLACFAAVLATGRTAIPTMLLTLTGSAFSIWAAAALAPHGFFVAFPLMAFNFLLLRPGLAWLLLGATLAGSLLAGDEGLTAIFRVTHAFSLLVFGLFAHVFVREWRRQAQRTSHQLAEIADKERVQAALFEISELADGDASDEAMYTAMHAVIGRLMYAENFYIVSWHREQGTIRFDYYVDSQDDAIFGDVPLENLRGGLTWHLLQGGRPLRGTMQEIAGQVRGTQRGVGSDARNWLGVPMFADGEVVGAMVVQAYEDGIVYSERDQSVLGFVASHVQHAIARRDQRERLEALVEARTRAVAGLYSQQGAVFQSAPVGLLIVGDGEVAMANPEAHRILGASPGMLEGRAVDPRLARGGEFALGEGADAPWVEVWNTPVTMEGHDDAWAVVIQDLTGRKALERRAEAALADALAATAASEAAREQAETANRAKGEFLAMMSHEIRTPMSGVIGMLGFALRDRHLSPGTRDQLELAQDNARALMTIINDVLDFSKIEARKLVVESVDFSVRAVIDDVYELMADRASSKSVMLKVQVDLDLPAWSKGDPTRLRQVLVNLVGNAVKFTEAGSVGVAVRHRLREDGMPMVEFSVKDTGIGIAPEALQRLFDAFTQADASTTRRYGGTGLGLAISRDLVALMGGRIAADSMPGLGTRFWFELPLPPGEAPSTAAAPMRPHTHRLRILCAEDYPTNQIIIRTLLEDRGHAVEIVENGRLAIEALANADYDLVLMDGRMPEMDGATATRNIRAGGLPGLQVRAPRLPIIALTANATSEDRRVYLESGMDAFLSKPINERELHDLLGEMIERLLAAGARLAPLAAEPAEAVPAEAAPGVAAPAEAAPGVAAPGVAAPGVAAPGVAALDALFGIDAAPPQDAPTHSPTADAVTPPGAAPARPDLRARMWEAFIADLPLRRQELEACLARREAGPLARVFHGLKGSAGFLEPDGPLHRLAASLEKAADREDWVAVDTDAGRLLALLLAIEEGQPHESAAR